MIPTIAVVVMLVTVAGCCIYISYRVGQGISPTSRLRRRGRVEAAIARSETSVREALEHHRDASGAQSRELLEESAAALASQVESLRRPLGDVGDRVNGMRVDLSRESRDLREEVRDTLRSVQDGTREHLSELVRMHAETLEKISGQIRELSNDDERRHESTRVSLERVGSELREASAKSMSELRGSLAAHLKDVGEAIAVIDGRIAEQGVLFGRTDDGIRTALHENEQRHKGTSKNSHRYRRVRVSGLTG